MTNKEIVSKLIEAGASLAAAAAAVRHAPKRFCEFPLHFYGRDDLVEANLGYVPSCHLIRFGYVCIASSHCGDAFLLDASNAEDEAEPRVVLFSHGIDFSKMSEKELRRYAKPVARSATHLWKIADAKLLDDTPRFSPDENDPPPPWEGIDDDRLELLAYEGQSPGLLGKPMSRRQARGLTWLRIFAAANVGGPGLFAVAASFGSVKTPTLIWWSVSAGTACAWSLLLNDDKEVPTKARLFTLFASLANLYTAALVVVRNQDPATCTVAAAYFLGFALLTIGVWTWLFRCEAVKSFHRYMSQKALRRNIMSSDA